MAKFMTSRPGSTTGPAGPVPSIDVFFQGIWNGRQSDSDRIALLLELQRAFSGRPISAAVEREIRKKTYLHGEPTRSTFPRRLYKMLRPEHADSLCRDGEFGVGPLDYYTRIEQESIADQDEGNFITYAHNDRRTIAGVIGIGKHALIYCTTLDPNAIFDGYDACVEITHPKEFFKAMAFAIDNVFGVANNRIKATINAPCHYQHTRIVEENLHGFTEAVADAGEASFDSLDSISNKKFLIKDVSYRADQEYRVAFELLADVPGYSVIKGGGLSKFCRRLR